MRRLRHSTCTHNALSVTQGNDPSHPSLLLYMKECETESFLYVDPH